MKLNSGELKRRLEVHRISSDRNELGEIIGGNVLVGTYWCKVKNTANKIVTSEQAEQDQNTLVLYTRYNKFLGSLDNGMIIVFEGNEWDIDSVVDPNWNKESLMITCVKRGR